MVRGLCLLFFTVDEASAAMSGLALCVITDEMLVFCKVEVRWRRLNPLRCCAWR
ncbi:hypothetical protein M758_9G058300 [Ceratodon purpureus]|nr:hypothetical protein M758_9G058300 [Ceratodon purpureus]